MSKYKVGDKVVYEVKEIIRDGVYLLSGWKESEPLSAYTEPLEAKIRRQAAEITRLLAENEKLKAENGNSLWNIEQARADGAEAAWELARKITCQPINGGFNRSEFEKIFGYGYISDIFEKYKYTEAAAKIAEWEKERDEIKVGDVVSREGLYGVVKSVSDDWLNGITASGISFQWLKRKCTKTGRHIDIDSFLKQIGEE